MNRLFMITLFFSFCGLSTAQNSSVDVFVIDSYITPEDPHHFILSFFTTEAATSKITIEDEYDFFVSDTLAEDHKTEIDISNLVFDSSYVKFVIEGETKNGKKYKSDEFEIVLPFKTKLGADRNTSLLTVCCFGGIIFGIPAPTLVFEDGESRFSLAKEIPLFSFYSGGYNYPVGYISVEYAHIFDAEYKNYLRSGYKQVFTVEPIEFISAGLSGFTTFKGYNGLSPEVTIGWFKVYNTFTVYSRYRFNFQPSDFDRNFHEISIGLYSNFFSINL